jgi:integrase/recombinase XerD
MIARRKKLPVVLEPEEAQKLILLPNKRYLTGLRNKAILSLMLNMGLRVSEVVNLRPGDLNLTKRKLRVVNGKGGVDRDLVIPEGLIELLKEWKKRKPQNSNYFFTTIKNKKGKITFKNGTERDVSSKPGKKLSVRYIQARIKKYAKKADISKNISPHTLRHTFGTFFYRQTKDIETLRKLLGHSDISTTQIYVTLANIDVENAMNGYKIIV